MVADLEPWERITDVIVSHVAVGGLDLAAPFDIDRYNMVVDEPYRVPSFGRVGALGVVIGNTRALWPCFVEAMRSDEALFASNDPLDDYVERVVRDAVSVVPFATEVRFGHEPPPRRVAMQRLAAAADLAALSQSHLSIHPIHGPWIALRAVVVVDVDGPPPASQVVDPCSHCDDACAPVLAKALDGGGWREWLAVRDACPIGRASRYTDPQIHYHYAKDRTALREYVRTGRWTNDASA